jgi:Zn ribbon nucleic-acid-binding protein
VEPDCPRCGDRLTRFTLADIEALTCESCGYVGVKADHSGEQTVIESWEDALHRFHEESK